MSQPVAQLESLKYRTTQIMESITALQFLIDANGQPVMPPWPDILARYNLLLSQTHSLSASLSSAPAPPPQPGQVATGAGPQNPFQNLALHPHVALPEAQLDHALAPLLRNQPTVQVIREEDAHVRRIAAVLKSAAGESEEVVRECAEMRRAHDARVERAVKAVGLLRERYEWRARVDGEGEDGEGGSAQGDDGEKGEGHEGDEEGDEMEANEAEDVLGQGTTP